VSDPIPTLREYGAYLESLDRPLDIDALVAGAAPNRNGAGQSGTRFGAGAPLLRAEDARATRNVVEIEPTSRERAGRRRRLVAAAVVAAAVLLIVGVVLLQQAGDDHIRTRPAGPASTTPTPPGSVMTAPTTTPGDASTEAPLLPESAPSVAGTSELVASVQTYNGASYYLYADGRLLWSSPQELEPSVAPQPVWPDGYVEQRLTAEGVERVRSQFLASGLFDSAQPPSECKELAVCVRADDGRLLSTVRSQSAEADQLLAYLKTLDSSLPDAEWADKEIKPYVAPEFAVCLQVFVANNKIVQVPPDLSVLLPLFPTRAAELLGREPTATHPHHQGGTCFEMTLAEARTLENEFLSPSVGGLHEYYGIVIGITDAFDAIEPAAPGGKPEGNAAYISFDPLFPDGGPVSG
jgi:hypothetical protein